MKIIRERKRVEVTTYAHSFIYNDCPGAGYSFDCDKDGNLLPMSDLAIENYNKCKSGEYDDVHYEGIETYCRSYTQSTIGICNVCGSEVILDGFTNTCDRCETDYNMCGQQLAHRSQWGEETGEYLSDILSV